MPIPNASVLSQKRTTKRTLNPTFVYMKTVKGKELARMHSKVLTEKFKAQETAIDKMRKRQKLLLVNVQEFLAKNKRISPKELKVLEKKFITFEMDLDKVFNSELELMPFDIKSVGLSSSKTPIRIHQLKSILTGAHQELEILESAGLVKKGFRERILKKANILRKAPKQ
ncbi:MAG: hypothetical protein WC821_00960 [archaeon]|jgi:hypothetical protein